MAGKFKAQVVKVQRPIYTTGNEDYLIYGKGRAHQVILSSGLVPLSLAAAMSPYPKRYFWAIWDSKEGT